MRFERLADTHDERYNAARALYAVSFPYHEQRGDGAQAAALASADYRFELIYDGDEFAGLMLCWETEDFIYVEHFCTAPEIRGRGIGAAALALLVQNGKKIKISTSARASRKTPSRTSTRPTTRASRAIRSS